MSQAILVRYIRKMTTKIKKVSIKTKEELINYALDNLSNDLKEIDDISIEEIISIWGFFKAVITDSDSEEKIYLTPKTSIIYMNKEKLEKNCKNIKILSMDEMIAV